MNLRVKYMSDATDLWIMLYQCFDMRDNKAVVIYGNNQYGS
jgi:hypothetical protein